MTFTEWLSLDPTERGSTKKEWHVFEPGYWHTLAAEAASRFAGEFSSLPHVQRICKSLYHSDELIIAVQTDCPDGELLDLPDSYLGFRVLQFAGKVPEGVLVDVSGVAGTAAA
jgi:hypothetical protein